MSDVVMVRKLQILNTCKNFCSRYPRQEWCEDCTDKIKTIQGEG